MHWFKIDCNSMETNKYSIIVNNNGTGIPTFKIDCNSMETYDIVSIGGFSCSCLIDCNSMETMGIVRTFQSMLQV